MRPCSLRVHTQLSAAAQPLDVCADLLERAAEQLYVMDPQIVSIGITKIADGYGYRVLRHRRAQVRALWELDAQTVAAGIHGVPLVLVDARAQLRPQLELPASSVGPGASQTFMAEQGRQRPLCAGLQLQNYDCDARLGRLASDRVEVGTLGMIVRVGADALIVSNNHVLAGQNRGQLGDRVLQAGGPTLDEAEVIARLERFVPLEVSPAHAHPRLGNVVWNTVDAAVARLARGVSWRSGYLPHHQLPALGRRGTPGLGDEVFKVGRTSGLRRGRIISVSVRATIPYAIGDCWFRNSFTIECPDGRPFSEPGDSGAAVVRSNGEVIGLVYAGNGAQTFACPITEVIAALEL